MTLSINFVGYCIQNEWKTTNLHQKVLLELRILPAQIQKNKRVKQPKQVRKKHLKDGVLHQNLIRNESKLFLDQL